MALMNDVYSYLEKNYRPNEPIFLSDLNILGMKAIDSSADKEADRIGAVEAF